MLRRRRQIRTQIQRALDATLFAVSLWLAHWLRSHVLKIEIFGGRPEIRPFHEYVWYLPLIFLLGPLFLEFQGFYNRPLLASRKMVAWQVARACVLCVTALIIWMFLVKEQQVARSVPIYFGAVSFLLLLAKEQA